MSPKGEFLEKSGITRNRNQRIVKRGYHELSKTFGVLAELSK